MTYKESYLMLKSVEEIIKEANNDVIVANMMGSSNERVDRIMQSAEEAINEKFPDHIADISKRRTTNDVQ